MQTQHIVAYVLLAAVICGIAAVTVLLLKNRRRRLDAMRGRGHYKLGRGRR